MDLVPRTTADLLRTAIGARAARRLTSRDISLRDLGRCSVAELTSSYGLSELAAEKAVAIAELARRHAQEPLERGMPFRSSREVFAHFGPRLRDLRVERFLTLLLDGKHRVLSEHLISQGTLTTSPVHPREVFAPAIRESAAAIVLVHNHPSGDSAPSVDDLAITRRLIEVSDVVGIAVLDHVVIGDGEYTSLSDRGLRTGDTRTFRPFSPRSM